MTEVEKILAAVAASKVTAMKKFEADWGTRDVGKVVGALRSTIKGSKDPNDWARKARATLK